MISNEHFHFLKQHLSQIINILVFISGLLFFNYILTKRESAETKQNLKRNVKISQFILEKYREENEEFFFQKDITNDN